MMEFNVDVAAMLIAGGGIAYTFGALRQRVQSAEARIRAQETISANNNALLIDIRERVLRIEHCLNANGCFLMAANRSPTVHHPCPPAQAHHNQSVE